MIRFRRSGKPFFLALLIGTFLPFIVTGIAHAATFDPSRIIDDGVFYNSSSMTVGQIQAFLNSKVPSCDNNGTQIYSGSTTRATYTHSKGFLLPMTCLKDYYENPTTHQNNLTTVEGQTAPIPAGAQSAAQIIYTAATFYGINPQVLLVTLQKESGLVTDDWPWPTEYQTAMGYGCPDNGPNHSANCSSLYFGFYNQVNWAAKQFRTYASEPNSFNYVPGPGNYVQYNPQPSCSGTTLNIQNQATASLYDYTPYQPNAAALAAGYGTGDSCSAYGNRNFWLYFNDWFGSTQFAQPTGGSLLSQASTGKIYLVTDGTRYYVPSWAMMTNYGLDVYPIQSVSDATIQQYSDGGTLTNLVWDSGGVYLVNNRVRYHVSSSMCTAWGFSCLDNTVVKGLGADFQTEYLRAGSELTQLAASNGVTYEMSAGKRLPIENTQTAVDLGLNTIISLPASSVNLTQPLGPLLITTPGVVRFSTSPTAYYYNGSSYYSVPSTSSYNDWGLGNIAQWNAPASSYDTTPPSTVGGLTSWYQDGSGNKYIIDGGRRVLIPAPQQSAWSTVTYATQPQTLANSLPQTTLQPFVSSGGIYTISGGKSHHVPTWPVYLALGITDSQTTVLGTDKLAPVPAGNDVLAEGTIIALQNDTQGIYVIDNGKTTHISDPNTYADYGFSWSGILVYPPAILSDYPLASSPLSTSYVNGTYYIVGQGTMYQLPVGLSTDFGVINSQVQAITTPVVKNSRPASLSRFMYDTDNGRIYYASGGAIHYIATYSAFVAYGGPHATISVINTAAKNLFVESQAVY